MSVWLEIHCDVRTDGMRATDILRPICLSHENDNPAAMAKNASSIKDTLRWIEQDAKARGWTKKSGKWTCPGCMKHSAGPTP